MISKLPKWIWLGGAVLACAAGMVNAIAFLSFTHQAATHVTGIFTHLSIGIFDLESESARQAAAMLLSFFFGAVMCGYIIHDGHLKMGRRYGAALALESALLFASTAGFVLHSVWGERLAAMAAGLQNAMVSTYSGAIVRTTHMTGILTDFGAMIGQISRGLKVDLRRLKLLGLLMFSFTVGGILGVLFYGRWEYLAMLVPATTVAASAAGYLLIRRFGLTA
jgi:uncharacterized membrane protein YoaK (UPF0700 family)